MLSALRVLVACVLAALLTTAAAAQPFPPSQFPDRLRERFAEPPAPLAQPGGPAIALPSTVAPKGAEKVMVRVRAVHIVGATVYGADALAPLYEDLIGEPVPLTAIYELAQSITAKYGNDGYVLSRAVVPPQQLDPKGAVVQIEVVEGYIDKVEWPALLSRYRDFFSHYAAKIVAQQPANIHTIERYLLLAGDLPGLKFTTSLRPSKHTRAAATLVVEVAAKPIDANAHIDNRGTPERGPFEYYGSVTFNNATGWHQALTFTYAGVVPLQELNYAAFNYKQVLTAEGLTFFADGSYAWGTPGTIQLETLQNRTFGPAGDAGFAYPFIRSREQNLTLTALGFASDNESNMLGAPFSDDRLRGARVRVDADYADQFQAVDQFYAILSQGIEGLGSTPNNNPLASRLGGHVDFTKMEMFIGRTIYTFRIGNGQSVRNLIGVIQSSGLKVAVQPQYTYGLTQDGAAADQGEGGDAAQYIVQKLQLAAAHRISQGANVVIAVIDSAIDANQPDFAGGVIDRYDAGCGSTAPDAHGTGMAGAIVSHVQLVGVAPSAKIIAICAFGGSGGSPEATSVKIIRGLDYAVQQGAKVVSMSFAGPYDPALAQALQVAREKGVLVVAAAGNAGAKSPPLYPGADPNVLAVTATDENDRLFVGANQGSYVALAAPGVNILVPAPDGGVQMTTGTSVATANISGVAALLLADKPSRTPEELRLRSISARRASTRNSAPASWIRCAPYRICRRLPAANPPP